MTSNQGDHKPTTFEDFLCHLGEGREKELLAKLWRAAGGELSGADALVAALRGELRITLRQALVNVADKHGRIIPPAGFLHMVNDADTSFRLVKPGVDYHPAFLVRLQAHLLRLTFASAAEFQDRSEALLAALRADSQAKNLLEGAHLPLALPKIGITDYGTALQKEFLPAVDRSYQAEFPGRKLRCLLDKSFAGNVQTMPYSRQDRLLAKMSEGPVVGIYFPACLQGFSIPAAREIVQMLPDGFVLTGAIEASVALIGYSGTMARDWHTIGVDCAANTWTSAENSLCFNTLDDKLIFGDRGMSARRDASAGLLFLG